MSYVHAIKNGIYWNLGIGSADQVISCIRISCLTIILKATRNRSSWAVQACALILRFSRFSTIDRWSLVQLVWIEAKYPSTDYNNNIPMFDVVRVRDRILGY